MLPQPQPPAPSPQPQIHRVVIVGGGFAGLNAARALPPRPVQVTLIDRRNFHLFQPLLYQVATGALSPANIAAPLRSILERQTNCEVLLGDVRGFDVSRASRVCFDAAAAAVRHADRRRRRAAQLLRPSGVGTIRTRPENDRRRHRNPPPAADGVRAGRARTSTRPPPHAAHVRHRRRRPDGRRNGRHDGRNCPPRASNTNSATSIRPTRKSCSSKPASEFSPPIRPTCRPRPSNRCSDWASSCAPKRW